MATFSKPSSYESLPKRVGSLIKVWDMNVGGDSYQGEYINLNKVLSLAAFGEEGEEGDYCYVPPRTLIAMEDGHELLVHEPLSYFIE